MAASSVNWVNRAMKTFPEHPLLFNDHSMTPFCHAGFLLQCCAEDKQRQPCLSRLCFFKSNLFLLLSATITANMDKAINNVNSNEREASGMEGKDGVGHEASLEAGRLKEYTCFLLLLPSLFHPFSLDVPGAIYIFVIR